MSEKALFIVNSIFGGGAERAALMLAGELAKSMQVDFVSLFPGEDYSVPDGVNAFCLGLDNSKAAPFRQLSIILACRKLNSFVKEREKTGKYRLITAHLMSAYFLARFSCISHRCLYVMHSLPARSFGGKGVLPKLLARVLLGNRKVVSVSEGVRKNLIEEFGMEKKDCFNIPNPVSPVLFNAEQLEPVRRRRPYILFIGRLEEIKRPDRAIEIFVTGRFYEQFDLVIMGKGSLQDILRKLAMESGHQDAIHFEGFQKDPFPWIKGCSAMLLTSDAESLANVVIEGLLLGARVVSSNCDFGPREIMTGDLARFLVAPSDINGYIKAIRQSFAGYPELDDVFVERYDPKMVAERYIKLYREQFQ